MKVFNYVKEYAEQIGGQFTDYDQTRSVIVVPLNNRFQTVLAVKQKSPSSGKEKILFTSKVCGYSNGIDLKSLVEENAGFDFSHFIIDDGYLKIEASCHPAAATEEQVRDMVQEVAQLADYYELKLTGKDVF